MSEFPFIEIIEFNRIELMNEFLTKFLEYAVAIDKNAKEFHFRNDF